MMRSAKKLMPWLAGVVVTINAYAACSSPPQYEGGGRHIENAAGTSSTSTEDSSVPDTSVPDTSVVKDSSTTDGGGGG